MSISTLHLGIFYMTQICDMEPTALLPLRRKACWKLFCPKKSWRLRQGLSPRTWVLKGSTLPLDYPSRYFRHLDIKLLTIQEGLSSMDLLGRSVSELVGLLVSTLISNLFCQTQIHLHNTRPANTCKRFHLDFILDLLGVNILLVSTREFFFSEHWTKFLKSVTHKNKIKLGFDVIAQSVCVTMCNSHISMYSADIRKIWGLVRLPPVIGNTLIC